MQRGSLQSIALTIMSCVYLGEATLVLYNPLTSPEDTLYQQHIHFLRKLLKFENCDQPDTEGDQLQGRKLSEYLTDQLISCRKSKMTTRRTASTTAEPTKLTNTSTTRPTTASTTTTTITPTTTPTITSTTTPTIAATTTPTTATTTKATNPIHVPSECLQATNLTEAWRRDYNPHNQRPQTSRELNCDPYDMVKAGRPWFRFAGEAGNRLLNDCPKYLFSCGSLIGLFSNDRMPIKVGVATTIYAYGRDCDTSKKDRPMHVMRCSAKPQDFIYSHQGKSNCNYSYCGMKA